MEARLQASSPSPVAFLLGAGASADARIPVMRRMHLGFIEALSADDRALATRVDAAIRPYARLVDRDGVDTELLLAGLEHFAGLSSDLSRHLLNVAPPSAEDMARAAALAQGLRAYIRQQCLIPTEADVAYLHPLIRLTNEHPTLDFFSVNYDLCVEMAADAVEVSCETGFRLYWEPEQLNSVGTPDKPVLRMHKLHGSVTWFRSEYQYLHLPVQPGGEGLKGSDGSPLQELLVYPALDKEPELSPYPYLLDRFRRSLRETKVLVVIGYAFGDQSLRHLLLEALQQNRQLQLLVVDPNETRAGRYFPGERYVHLKGGLLESLANEQLITSMNKLIEANQLTGMGLRSVGANSSTARQRLTDAIDRYLDAQHWAAARDLVAKASKAIITPPRGNLELLVRNREALLEHAPAFDAEDWATWWSIVPYHLDGLEERVVQSLDQALTSDQLPVEQRLVRRPFRSDAFRWSPNVAVSDRVWWIAQLRRHLASINVGEFVRTIVLRRLIAQLEILFGLYEYLTAPGPRNNEWVEPVRGPIAQYMQERGVSELGLDVVNAPV